MSQISQNAASLPTFLTTSSIRQNAQTTTATPERRPREKVAIVLNGNARAVDDRLVSDLRGLLQDETLYVSHSLDQSRFIARTIVNRGYDVVLCGGGDGTFTQVVSDIAALQPRKLPTMGILRLGTGNALATVLGARGGSKGIAADLRAIRSPQRRTTLDLLDVEGRLAPFAGAGLDAMILEDYDAIRQGVVGRAIGGRINGPLGYGLAIAGRSMWRIARNERPIVTIRNEGNPVYRMDHDGHRIGQPLPRGTILHHGPVTLAAASTIPNYGFQCRLFPQADTLSGRFQLRVTQVGPFEVVSQLPKLFSGEIRSKKVQDYACTAVSMHLNEGTAFQIGGDLVSKRHSIRLGLRQIEVALGSDADLPQQDGARVALHAIA